MSIDRCRKPIATLVLFLCGFCAMQAIAETAAQHAEVDAIPASHLLQPAELARKLNAADGEKPLILQVGSRVLFVQAHIPGSEYVGAAGQQSGARALKQRVGKLDRAREIVIYCGCCPWPRCPNIRQAYAQLVALGFTHVRALYIGTDFGTDWVAKGYPIAKGEH